MTRGYMHVTVHVPMLVFGQFYTIGWDNTRKQFKKNVATAARDLRAWGGRETTEDLIAYAAVAIIEFVREDPHGAAIRIGGLVEWIAFHLMTGIAWPTVKQIEMRIGDYAPGRSPTIRCWADGIPAGAAAPFELPPLDRLTVS